MRKFRHSHRLQGDLLSEINVTPFVDVLLILLVAFLISAPLLTHSLPIRLPDGKLNKSSPEFENVLRVSIDDKKNILLDDEIFNVESLKLQLPNRAEWKNRERPVYIQMDERNKKAKFIRIPKFSEIPYPTIMEPNLVIEYYSR